MTDREQEQRGMCGAVIAGIGIGAVLAAVVALLMAPRAGHQTRTELKESAGKVKARAERLVAAITDKCHAVVEDKTSALARAIDAGKRAYAEKKSELESQVKSPE
jgi:gas vesicle protein